MVEQSRHRVLVLFETHWDRRQLAACDPARLAGIELVFPPPDDVECPSELDPVAFIESAATGALGRVDGVLSSSDYPGATIAAAIATRLGLPGSRPEAVIGAAHKYYSRIAQRDAVPAAVPPFALLDPRRPAELPALSYPVYVKPVKGAFSVLARRIDDAASLAAFLGSPAVLEFGQTYLAIFNRLVATCTDLEIDGHFFIAEGVLVGDLVTVEGFAFEGAVEILGIVDSTLHASGSFARFDYPSALPPAVQERMADIARRVITRLDLEHGLFNIEMMHDAASDRISIIEVNPRICGQFADLYRKVDGTSSYEVALDLCTGVRPRLERGSGPHAAAASFPLRVFEPCTVERAPGDADVRAAEALFPDTLVWSECVAGDVLADFDLDEDGTSHRYAVINVGGSDRQDLQRRCEEIRERLGYRMSAARAR